MTRDTAIKMTRLVEVKDLTTAAHTWRVVLYIQALAEAMGWEMEIVRRMMRGAAVHDVGKIDLPADILCKPDRLTDAEYEIVQHHPILGYDRLIDLGEDDPIVLSIVRSHHERLNGTGYPDRLKHEAIPVAARLFAVVDTFDAMTSVRAYRPTVPVTAVAQARRELLDHVDDWYWSAAVEVFIDLLDSGRLSWIQRHFNEQSAPGRVSTPQSLDEIDKRCSELRGRG